MRLIMLGLDGLSFPYVVKLAGEGALKKLHLLLTRNHREIPLDPKHAISAVMWNTIFSGLPPEKHGIRSYVIRENGEERLLRYSDIPREVAERFVWTIAEREGFKVAVLNAPIVLPPYFRPPYLKPDLVDQGVPIAPEACIENMLRIVDKAKEVLIKREPDLLVLCITALDRISHFHYGDEVCRMAYITCDREIQVLTKLAEDLKYEIMVFSDHGFRPIEEVPDHELILKKNPNLKGDHAPTMTYAGPLPIEKAEDIAPTALQILHSQD